MKKFILIGTRPGNLTIGPNLVAGTKSDKILNCVSFIREKQNKWANPFGDVFSGQKIIDLLLKLVYIC